MSSASELLNPAQLAIVRRRSDVTGMLCVVHA